MSEEEKIIEEINFFLQMEEESYHLR